MCKTSTPEVWNNEARNGRYHSPKCHTRWDQIMRARPLKVACDYEGDQRITKKSRKGEGSKMQLAVTNLVTQASLHEERTPRATLSERSAIFVEFSGRGR